MRILVSGSRGLVGAAIVAALEARDDEVRALVRGRATRDGDVSWDTDASTIDRDALAAGRFDAVLHLAGESLIGRWGDDKRERILRSRVDGTTALAEAIAAIEPDARPATFLVASATGIYGDRGEELLTEESARGTGFLADVVALWEAACEPARAAGVRVVNLRMAPVQAADGGALKAQLLPFRLGAGGRVGSGRQFWPWISLGETVRAWLFALDSTDLDGPLNLVGPTPARNREYAKALGRVLNRPAVLPAPTPIMKLAMGAQLVDEMLLSSQKVAPARLEGHGFEFTERTVEDALRGALGR